MLITLAHKAEAMEQDYPLAVTAEAALHTWQAVTGDILTVRDNGGNWFRGRLLPDGRTMRLFEPLEQNPEPPAPRCLCQAIPDKERMIWIIQKAVELGATSIQPLQTDRSNQDSVRQDKATTWHRIARQAAKQCRRAIVPAVLPTISLESWLTMPAEENGIRLFLDITGSRQTIGQVLTACRRRPVAVLVGPEGGFSGSERSQLGEANLTPISLGTRIYRTETAAMAFLAILAADELN